MKWTHIIITIIMLLGFDMRAQTINIENEKLIPATIQVGCANWLYLDNRQIRRSIWSERILSDYNSVKYFYKNNEYRRLLPSELKQLDAMPKIKVKSGSLYFDNKKIRTNKLWVWEITEAYYWNGGVITQDDWANVGFINLKTGKCKFKSLGWTGAKWLGFLTPITINASNDSFAFDVKTPEKVTLNENFNTLVMLTNVSDIPRPVPDYLLGGLCIFYSFDVFDEAGNAIYTQKKIGSGPIRNRTGRDYSRLGYEEHLGAKNNKFVPLAHSETRESSDSFKAKDLFPKTGRYRLVFYWDGPLNENNLNDMSRFTCEKWIEVIVPPPYHINHSSKSLLLDVKIPDKVIVEQGAGVFGIDMPFECTISLTNISDKPIMLPASILEGFGVANLNGARIIDSGVGREQPDAPGSIEIRQTPLMPSEIREAIFSLRVASWMYREDKGVRLVFYWHGLLNPEDKYEVSEFVYEKWVELAFEKKR